MVKIPVFEKNYLFLKKGVDRGALLCYNIKLHYNCRYKGITMPFGNFRTDIIYSDNFGGSPRSSLLTGGADTSWNGVINQWSMSKSKNSVRTPE